MKNKAGTLRNRLVVAMLVAIIFATAAYANDQNGVCDKWSYWWPLCKAGIPSIPRYNLPSRWGAPRPPLVPKNSKWCSSMWVDEHYVSDGTLYGGFWVGWYMTNGVKHGIHLWPDYYTYTFTFYYYDVNDAARGWQRLMGKRDPNGVPPQPYQRYVDCDA